MNKILRINILYRILYYFYCLFISLVKFNKYFVQVLETIRQAPFLVTMHYAFQTPAKLHLVLDYVSGGELFTHLYQREKFKESEVRIYIAEIVLALQHLHKVKIKNFSHSSK